jgi:hypothetical protein
VKPLVAYRSALAVAMVACGIVILVRVFGFGLRIEALPGIVLGAAMIALGVHRLSVIARLRRGSAP